MNDPVLLERVGAIAYLTLNRPEAGNAIDVALARALHQAIFAAERDAAVRCLVVRGNGRLFCAGGDVGQLTAAGDARPALLRELLAALHPALLRLACMAKPVVTAIHGPAAGAGVGLAAVGDVALADPAAHFTMAYSRIGLSPDGGATWLLPRLVGLRRAQELALVNRRLSANEAADWGLITRVVAEGTLADAVAAVAARFTQAASGAIGRTKKLLLESQQATLARQLDAEAEAIVAQSSSAETALGLAAFVERREPNFATDAC